MDSDSEVDDILNPKESETVVDERKHNKLLDAISSLDGSKRHKLTQRTVLTNQVSEFNFATSKDAFSKVQLHELVGSLKESGSHGDLKKQLSNINKHRQRVDVPLPKHEKEKIDRTTAYESTTVDLSKWDPIVNSNREADQLQFPLQKSDVKLVSSQQFVSRFQPRTPLEMEVAKLLRGSDNVVKSKHQELTPAEQRALKAMDLQEAKERRNELSKYRALMTYKEAKAKRQKKIKSKKYHRILKRERLRKETKDLEEMKTQDPEAYEEKVRELESARIQERVTLKHRGGSKFARRQMMFAKYNDRARDQVQEMLQMSRELTKKTEVENDDADDDSDDDMHVESQATSEPRTYKGDNPWMAKPQAVTAAKPAKPAENDSDAADDDGDEAEQLDEEDDTQTSLEEHIANDKSVELIDDVKESITVSDTEEVAGERQTVDDENDIDEIFSKIGKKKKKKLKSDTEKIGKSKTKKEEKAKTKNIKDNKSKHVKGSNSKEDSGFLELDSKDAQQDEDDDDDDDVGFISEDLSRKRTIEDMDEMLETGEAVESTRLKKARTTGGDKSEKKQPIKPKEPSVDPKKLFTLETKLQQSGAGPELIGDDDDDDDMDAEEQQRMTIAQAFADDDVIEEFRQEKQEKEDKDKPADIDLFLPGWGAWGGTGLKPPKRKKKRFTIKAPVAPRKDVHLGHVIISENKSEAIKKHQVSQIPYPFTNANQFEGSIRAPIGRTWNPEMAFQQLTMPKVKTQIGAIIAPMDKAEVFKNQKMKKPEIPESDKPRLDQQRQNKSSKNRMQNKKHKQKGQGKIGKVAKKK